MPSLGLMARLGVPVGGRVRKLRAVKDNMVAYLEEMGWLFLGSVDPEHEHFR